MNTFATRTQSLIVREVNDPIATGEESLVKSTEASCDSRVAEELSALKDWMEYTRSEK